MTYKKLFYAITALCFIGSLIFVNYNAFYERPIAKVTKTTLEHQSDVQDMHKTKIGFSIRGSQPNLKTAVGKDSSFICPINIHPPERMIRNIQSAMKYSFLLIKETRQIRIYREAL